VSRTPAAAVAPPDLPGYRFLRHLGAGGNAQVFLYEQDLPRREVAVKVLNESALSEAARRRFTAEANVTAGLPHRHIVQVFDAKVTDDGRPYIVMPYYPQPNLSVRARRAHFSVAEVLRVGIQIGSAVETSHRHDVLHRDIKPQNILTDSYGEPALTDFGIATTMGGDGPEGLSVPWSPPEILYGSAPGDRRSDVYSLGATLWHLLVGRSPFEQPGGDNGTYKLMGRIKSDPVPRTGRADVPDSLERLLRQAMAKDPAARPQTAMALIRGLQSIEQELRLPVTHPILPSDGQPPGELTSDTLARTPPTSGETTFSRGYERDRAPGRGDTRPPGDWSDTWRPGPAAQPAWGQTAEPAWGADPRTHAGAAPHRGGWAGDTHDVTVARGLTGATDDGATRARGPGRPDPRSGARGPEEDETRARAPMRLDPWADTPVPRPEGRVREFPPQPPDGATLVRPRQVDPGFAAVGRPGPAVDPRSGLPGQPGQHGKPRRSGRALALGVGGAVLAAVAVVTVFVVGRGGSGPQSAGTPTATGQATTSGGAQDAIGPGATTPGTPTVKVLRVSPTEAQFYWTYDNTAAGDTFLWQRIEGTAGAADGSTATARLSVHLASGQTICIQVMVRRADGEVSGESAEACAGN
jgi:serine/threonine protein kinase